MNFLLNVVGLTVRMIKKSKLKMNMQMQRVKMVGCCKAGLRARRGIYDTECTLEERRDLSPVTYVSTLGNQKKGSQ